MSVAEVYAYLTMGLGYDPEYVLDKMAQYEIDAAMKYNHYKKKDMWETGRFFSYVIAKANGSKAQTIGDFFEFPWEEEQEEDNKKPMTKELIEQMKKEAQSYINQNYKPKEIR